MRAARQARILAMQALCQWEVQREVAPGWLASLWESLEAPADAVAHAEPLVETILRDHERIDQAIAAVLEHWDLGRLSPVERNVLRVALVELEAGGVPPKVAINEAVEIGREFGGADTPRFVNGVLDRLFHQLGGAG